MKFITRITILCAISWLTFYLLKEFPGKKDHIQTMLTLYLIVFGAGFYFLAPYMDAIAALARRGMIATTPNSNPDRAWEIVGIIFAVIGSLIWLTNQWI